MSVKTKQIEIADLVAPAFHLFVLTHHLVAINNSNVVLENAEEAVDHRVLHMVDFAHMFFTSWNMAFQTLYYMMALVYDVCKLMEKREIAEKVNHWKGYLFTALIFPCGFFVTALFWSIYNIDRELVFSHALDDYVPSWLNHCLHTNISIFLIGEVFIASQKMPTFKAAFLGLTITTIIYNVLFFITYFTSGSWIYALFQILSWPQRICVPICNYIATLILMRVGIAIQGYKNQVAKGSEWPKHKSS